MLKKLRIMLVSPLFAPYPGGASVYFELLSKGLAKKKDVEQVIVLSRYLKGEKIFTKNQNVSILRLLPFTRSQNRCINFIQTIIIPAIILVSSKLFRIDLIHYHSLTSYKIIHCLSFLFRIPLICDMRDLAAKNENASLDYYHHASKIICCSENICDFVHSDVFLNERTAYIPIPFTSPDAYTREERDLIKKKYGLDAVERYICFAGAILKYKGVFDLMEALKILLSEDLDWRLVLIGPMELRKDSEDFKRFQSEINSSQIIYLGPLGREDTLGLIQDSDIFILPSTTEALPRVCLEAIALGVKAILPGCVPEFNKHCPGFVLDEINPVNIANKIMQVSKSDKRPTYPFSIHDCSQIIDQTYSLYGELIRNGKRPPVVE